MRSTQPEFRFIVDYTVLFRPQQRNRRRNSNWPEITSLPNRCNRATPRLGRGIGYLGLNSLGTWSQVKSANLAGGVVMRQNCSP